MQGAVLAFTPGGSVEWRVAVITARLVMGIVSVIYYAQRQSYLAEDYLGT